MLIEDDIPGYENSTTSIKILVTFMIQAIAKEGTRSGIKLHLMLIIRFDI